MQLSEASLGDLDPIKAGTVTLAQNSLIFQIGSNAEQTTSLALQYATNSLGTGIGNVSDFALSDIDVTASQGSGRMRVPTGFRKLPLHEQRLVLSRRIIWKVI